MLIRLSAFFFASFIFIACSSGDGPGGADASNGAGDDAGNDATADAVATSACDGLDEGAPCGEGRICVSSECLDSICGDGLVDAQRDEACDDGNLVDGDGCDYDCTFSCDSDGDCDNANDCDGIEACVDNANGKKCQKSPPEGCPEPMGVCADAYCDPDEGERGECIEVNRSVCYRDKDGDGYPDEDVTVEVQIVGGGGECMCPGGFSPRREDGIWDCNDARADVKPEATAFHALPHCPGQAADAASAPCEGDGCLPFVCENGATPSFDYDCDGQDTPRYQKTSVTCTGSGFRCTGGGGWSGKFVPGCGEEAAFLATCSGLLGLGCGGSVASHPQECR